MKNRHSFSHHPSGRPRGVSGGHNLRNHWRIHLYATGNIRAPSCHFLRKKKKLSNVTWAGPARSPLFPCLFSTSPPPFAKCLIIFWDFLRDIRPCFALQWRPMALCLACEVRTSPLTSATGRHAALVIIITVVVCVFIKPNQTSDLMAL